ncbi:MAG: hypothetical protein COY58_08800 [Gammaproteobacteria bacterium CG_4_10_14_0_8_um_filter_38_16]|nr:MAG: hypothetical protein COY58_08800 [Gammaproteobacteria bacterium CG_4_10_14_0_8_um_filter_38_16]PJA02924.1 MAG: hypothetical protein COX72_07825 [Gammaproteobacteria bacterium CG_4_10_14_0_2_um_filter_38_22]PJB11409.1 MAG: hypothetical protein CO120_00415 [Gammaproteobacteria bacterium CG_4_9_14_3_um_filter_38_9]
MLMGFNRHRFQTFFLALVLSYGALFLELFSLIKINFLKPGLLEGGNNFFWALSQLHFVAFFPLIYFLFVLLLFHALFSLVVAMASQYWCARLKFSKSWIVTLAIWLFAYASILFLNAVFFPRTDFSFRFVYAMPDYLYNFIFLFSYFHYAV